MLSRTVITEAAGVDKIVEEGNEENCQEGSGQGLTGTGRWIWIQESLVTVHGVERLAGEKQGAQREDRESCRVRVSGRVGLGEEGVFCFLGFFVREGTFSQKT